MSKPELTPAQCVLYAALVALLTLIITLLSLWAIPGDFGARLYQFANVALLLAGLWLVRRNIVRHWR